MSKNRRRLKAAGPFEQREPPTGAYAPHAAPNAPWPQIDRYPAVLGSNLTLTYLASVFRMCQTGYRREYVDCLDELLERDPHAFCCYSTRILSVASSRISIVAPECRVEEKELAEEIANRFRVDFFGIENLRQSLAALLWACYYGVQASEIGWSYTDHYKPRELYWVHSRRIAYPDPNSWSPRIWDLGAVNGWGFLESPTAITMASWGLAIEDYPNKFIVHAPQYRGDYPTRDGVGRETAIWSALKTMGARQASQYIERFSKPWVVANFATQSNGVPRATSDDGLAKAESAVKGLGSGTVSAALLEDGIKVNLSGPGANSSTAGKLVHTEFISICNAEISKAVLGTNDTVETGPNGSRASTEERAKGQRAIYKYEAECLSDTLRRDLAMAWMRLNYPQLLHLCPLIALHIEEELTPQQHMAMAKDGASIGMPVDADALSKSTGVVVVAKDAESGRICLPVKPIEDLGLLDVEYVPAPPPAPVNQTQPKEQQQQSTDKADKNLNPADNGEE